MKRTFLLLTVMVVLVGNGVCRPAVFGSALLPRYTVQGDGFTVSLPARPAFATTRDSRKDGKERTKHSLTLTKDGVVYSIEIFENLERAQSLEEFISESSTSLEYDATTKLNLTVDGFVGTEYSSPSKTTRMQFFATEDRLLRFVATGPASASGDIKDFFASIRLREEPIAIDASMEVYTGKEVDAKARLRAYPAPTYTQKASDNKVQGTVILKVIFAKTGSVEHIRVVAGLPDGLTEEAIRAASQIKFVPAMKDGKPVSMWMQLEYNFNP